MRREMTTISKRLRIEGMVLVSSPDPSLREKREGGSGTYRMAGNFRGSQFSRFSRLTGDPRKLNPRNKKAYINARAITGGVAIVVHAAAQLD